MNPAQPPEGILDPQQPYWPADRVGEVTWLRLKGKLTGRPVSGLSENFTSYVKLGDADADRLIANIKKYGKYPQVNQNDKYGGAYNNEAYQKWLVEEFLEKPFREEVDKKIEEAEQEARLKEIKEQTKKDKESVPLPPINKEEEQKELDQNQEVLEDKIDDLTEDIDSELPEPEQQQQNQSEESKESSKEEPTEEKTTDGIEEIRDSLQQIKGSLQTQVSDLQIINQNDSLSLSSLETLKKLFETQNVIIKKKAEEAETKAEEQSLEQTQITADTVAGTDLTADNKAEGVIQGVDGNVLTVKTTEGEFKQGQQITQGGGGGGFFDMLKGIAGKFFGKGRGGGVSGGSSPTSLSSGGFLNTPYPSPMAEGGLTPGIYDKPTRGNLGMNQMVIPLNRNVGKPFRQDNNKAALRKKDQPMIDVMSQPLKAIGLSILAVAGNFLKALGPLGGFFAPYVSGLVKAFSIILGVPGTIVMGLLGGPAYAAMEEQDKQQNIFSKLWNDLMKKFGFDFSGESDEEKKEKKGGGDGGDGGGGGGGMIPGDAPPEVKAMLDAISAAEGSWDSVNPSTNVPGLSNMTIADARRKALQVADEKNGSGAMGKWQQMPQFIIGRAKSAGLNPDTDKFNAENQTKIARMLMAGVYPGGERQLVADVRKDPLIAASHLRGTWPSLPGGSQENAHSKNFVSNFKKSIQKYSAESGTSIGDMNPGKIMGWSIIEGPNSGYDMGPGLEMHGKEAYLRHENGASILPIENNKYSLTKNPEKTISRWKEILGSKNYGGMGSYESGGRVESGRRHAARLRAQRASEQRSRLGVQKVNGRWTNMGVSDEAVGRNPWWQVWNKKGATAERRRKQEALALSLASRLNAQEANNTRTQPTSTRPANPFTPSGGTNKKSSSSPEKKPPTETDLMMEKYNQLIAAGNHTEAKQLGMQIWNKTWKKTDKGLERIPTTPVSATSSNISDSVVNQITNVAYNANTPSIVPIPQSDSTPQLPIVVGPSFEEIKWAYSAEVAKLFG